MGWWESKVAAANQMLSSWMPLVSLLLLFSSYLVLGFGFFPILYTSLLLLLSTSVVLYSTVSKHKASVQVDNLVEEEKDLCSDQRENIAPTPLHKHESAQEQVNNMDVANNSTTSQDLLSEVGWSFQYDVDHYSDGSISDEESLIEIALPSGHYVGQMHKDDEPIYNNCCLQQSLIREFLAEFNEEENLIEIDISMGSIKYSRFEIKA